METELDATPSGARALRALSLIAVSVLVLVGTGIAYLHPSLSVFTAAGTSPAVLQSAYSVSAVDFIDSKTGWVVAQFPSGNIAVLHTTDGGAAWTRQLSLRGNGHAQYIKFFDMIVGVFAMVGGSPVLYRTYDGGASWAAMPMLGPGASLLSVSFLDSRHGWMLARQAGETPGSPPNLYRTEDRGGRWINLGRPLAGPGQTHQVRFSSLTMGWLATSGPEPFAYRSKISATPGHGWRFPRRAEPGLRQDSSSSAFSRHPEAARLPRSSTSRSSRVAAASAAPSAPSRL